MPLAMSRPWKHPNSGVYWLRKGVPEDLRALVGKREEKRSLQTRDPVEAKRRHAEALAEIESRWANLRIGPKTLTEIEARQMAAVVHDRWLQQHQDNPSQQPTRSQDAICEVHHTKNPSSPILSQKFFRPTSRGSQRRSPSTPVRALFCQCCDRRDVKPEPKATAPRIRTRPGPKLQRTKLKTRGPASASPARA
jgi:hypothetical protein